jgi:predicted transcriptional regulator
MPQINLAKRKPRSLAKLRDEMRAVAEGTLIPSFEQMPTPSRTSAAEELELLNILASSPSLTVKELAHLAGTSASQTSRTLQRLADRGLVRLVKKGQDVLPVLVSHEVKVSFKSGTIKISAL